MMRIRYATFATAVALLGTAVVATPLSAQQGEEWGLYSGNERQRQRGEMQDQSGFQNDDSAYDWGYYVHFYNPYVSWQDPLYNEGWYVVLYDLGETGEGQNWTWSVEQDRWIQSSEMDQRSGQGGRQNRSRQQRGRRGGQRQELAVLRGTVESYRTVNLEGQRDRHTVVRIRTEGGAKRLVNLGPKTDIEDLGLQQGDKIVVQGRKGHIAGKPVLMAQRIKTTTFVRRGRAQQDRGMTSATAMRGEQRGGSRRSLQTVRGEIESWTETQVGDESHQDHLMVRLRLENGRTATVDFGPNATLSKLDLEQGDFVAIRGHTREIDGRQVLLARDFRVAAEPIQIDWSQASDAQRGEPSTPMR